MNKLVLLLSAVMFSFSLAAITPSMAQGVQTPTPTVQVNSVQNGQTVYVTQGTTVEIALEENLSTGHAWQTRTIIGAAIDEVTFEHISGVTAMPGASGTCIIRIQPQGVGSTTLQFDYNGPNHLPTRSFTLTVVVTK